MTLRLAVLGSTNGSILPTLIQQLRALSIPAEIVLIISDREHAGLLEKAALFQIPSIYLSARTLTREAYGDQLTISLREHKIDAVLLIGFMRILSEKFVNEWPNQLLNVHPSLLPKHAGLMDLAVHQSVLDAHEKESGCTVHFVTGDVDDGPIVIQKHCAVDPNDTAETLKKRVQGLEVSAFIEAIKKLIRTHDE